jgi:hypothetical protein
MPTLTSPGVAVFVNDQSIYSEPNPTTIPLVVIATRSNKTTPDGGGTARGTTEANKLRVVGSQRELLQNYGNPVFVSSAGEPVPGEETNETGLLALHTFLGRGSRAFVLRADIDLGGLVPTSQEPVLPPPDGTYWVKNTAVIGGIFKRVAGQWVTQPFRIYTTTPGPTDGADGDWAFDYSNLDGIIRFKDAGVWRAATPANLTAQVGPTSNLAVQPTSPVTPQNDDFWYKTTSSAGGVNLFMTRYRAVDGVFVTVPIIRQTIAPTPNQGTVWEDLSATITTGARPLYIGTGSAFIPLPFVIQPQEPVTEPTAGVLWYDDTFTDFALYVEGTDFGRGNEWVPVATTTVSNPSASQKVISASAPQFPQEGAIWVDISTPQSFDYYPVVKRWQGAEWVDITDSVQITPEDPLAGAVLNGTYWLNTGEMITRNTVKVYDPNFRAVTVQLISNVYTVVPQTGNFWYPTAGTKFGRRAVRDIIVEKMQAAVVINQEIRAEANYFQLIACPGYPEVYEEMIALNIDNGETAFVVADTPKFMIPTGIPTGRELTAAEWATNSNNVAETGEDGFSSARSPYAGFWYPWGNATNVDGETVFVPPSHMALRTIAYSDSVAAPWFPPAGVNRGRVDNATSVGYLSNLGEYTPIQLTNSMRDVLYENDINPIMFKPNTGLVVWGQKSWAATASALDRVNVARLVAKMKYDLQRLLEPYLFEINDPVTRRSAQVSTERYLAGLKSLRALYDYAARCDESNNTNDRIDRNEMWVDVAIQPAKSIEFIYVPITILNTGEDFPF